MLREASADVPLLSNTIEAVEFLDIACLNQARLELYKELDDYMRIDPGRAFAMEEMKLDQTFREFLARETNIVSNLAKINAQPRVELQKYILAEAFCLMYGIKYRIKIQHYIYDKAKGLVEFAFILNEIIKQEGLDPKFNKTLTQADIDRANEYRVNPTEELKKYAVPVNEPTATKIAKEENMALHSQTDHITKDKVVSEEKDSKNRRSDNLTDSEDFTERLKKKCYQALASDSEVTHEQLKESAEFLDTVVIFNFTKVRGAQKKFIRKMKKQLRGPSSFQSGALTNNNYNCNNDNYNNKYSNVNNNNNVKTTTQDLSGTRRRDRDVSFSEREEKICDRCGKMAKHRAAECQGDAFKVRRSAYTTSSSSSRKPRDHLSDDDESNQKCDSKLRLRRAQQRTR